MWRRKPKIETILGPETQFEGILHSKGIIRIDGLVTGGVAEAEQVIVGETGKVEGDIQAKSVMVAGHVIGNITASNHIEILPSSQVYGDITTPHLTIYDGVIFQGNCTMTRKKTEIIKIERRTCLRRLVNLWDVLRRQRSIGPSTTVQG